MEDARPKEESSEEFNGQFQRAGRTPTGRPASKAGAGRLLGCLGQRKNGEATGGQGGLYADLLLPPPPKIQQHKISRFGGMSFGFKLKVPTSPSRYVGVIVMSF